MKNKLIIFDCKNINYMKNYLIELSNIFKDLNPKLIYLNQKNIENSINKIAQERISPDENYNWINLVINYVENMNYSKNLNLRGFDAMINFFQYRKKLKN